MKKQKIAILTHIMSYNFGAVLQGFALSKFLKELGFDVTFIKYFQNTTNNQKKSLTRRIDLFIKSIIVNIVKKIFIKDYSKFIPLYRTCFNTFRDENIKLTKNVINLENINADDEVRSFDIFISGSDWVWNYPYDRVFFLDFLKDVRVKRISYAASGSTPIIADKDKANFLKLLNNFDAISTREQTFTDNINKISEKKSQTMPDPTLLFGSMFWANIAGEKPIIDSEYILIYSMKPNLKFAKLARECKKRFGVKVVGIVYGIAVINLFGTGVDEIKLDIGPKEFLNLIKYAKFVLTSSYHGTIFSCIFHTPFISYSFSAHDKRMLDFLKEIGLENFYFSETKTFNQIDINSYNFEKVEDYLKISKQKALNFFVNLLN